MMNYAVRGTRKVPLAALLVAAMVGGAGAGRADPPAPVAEIVDGDTVRLADGRVVRLAGIEAPKPPPGGETARAWPLSDAARDALDELLRGRAVALREAGTQPDRHGRWVAHLFREDGVWIEGELLRRGVARVRTAAEDRAQAGEMLALEEEARNARRGLWRSPAFAVRDAAAVGRGEGFQLVEGRVVEAAAVKGDVYLNFGPDWRTDFTVQIPRRVLRLFREAKLDPAAWSGRRVRVRGWLQSRNGPLIEATHPEQIELLD
jgi:endonuclease YncB( thermonuclease family)